MVELKGRQPQEAEGALPWLTPDADGTDICTSESSQLQGSREGDLLPWIFCLEGGHVTCISSKFVS